MTMGAVWANQFAYQPSLRGYAEPWRLKPAFFLTALHSLTLAGGRP